MLDSDSRPKLVRGCRLRTTADGEFLLMPESVMRMNGTGCEIVKRCDGSHSVEEIVAELQAIYAVPDTERIGAEVTSFLIRLQEKRAIEV